MSVAHEVTLHRLEVGIEASPLVHGQRLAPGIHALAVSGTCGIFPLSLCREAVRLYEHTLTSERAAKEIRAPVGERVCLFPAHTHHGIVVVARVREIHPGVRLVVGVLEIVDPRRGVGIDVHDVCVEEIVVAGEGARQCLADDGSLICQICRILGDYGQVGVDGQVGVVLTHGGVEPVLALCSRRVVIDLIAVVELCGVKLATACYGIGAVHALYGTALILVGVAPGNGLVPVQIRLNGVALFVFLYLELLVAAV